MNAGIVQIQPEPRPSGYGEIIAMLEIDPELLVSRYGLELFDGTDNLDDCRAAAIRLPSGRQVGLLRHVGAPYDGVELHADQHDDTREAIHEVLQAMGLPDAVVRWTRDVAPAAAHAR